jgi:hypothetical protein
VEMANGLLEIGRDLMKIGKRPYKERQEAL